EGAQVHRGDVLARVADLTAFRVDATISEVHASRIRVGQPATVRIDDTRLEGVVSRVVPAIQNGLVTLSVSLRENNHPRLRSNLRVEVDLVTDRRARALRVAKGAFGGSEGATYLFVVTGARAVKRGVKLGVSSAERYEVLDGPTRGRVRVGGKEVTGAADRALARVRNEHIGFVFQTFHLVGDLTVLDNVEIPLLYRSMSRAERRRRAQAALERVGLASRVR